MPHLDANWRATDSFHEDQLRSRSIALAIIGSGALGAQICLEFTKGSHALHKHIISVTIVDPDLLEAQNVPASDAWRMLVTQFGQQVIGNCKSELLAQYCRHNAPHIQWTSMPYEVADVGWKVLQAADIIITCTDSVLSRMETAYAARMLGKPMLDAGVLGQNLVGGRVAWYAPHVTAACYSCGLSNETRSTALEHIGSSSLSCSTLPLIEAMGGYAEGASSVTMVAKLVAEQLSQAASTDRSYVLRAAEAGVENLDIQVSEECPWHYRPKLISLEDDRPIRKSLSQDDVLLLPWAMALTTVCDACGTRQETPQRVAKLRNGMRCPHCGISAMRPEHVIDRITFEDELAERTPLQIGLPSGNVLPVRNRIQPQRAF